MTTAPGIGGFGPRSGLGLGFEGGSGGAGIEPADGAEGRRRGCAFVAIGEG